MAQVAANLTIPNNALGGPHTVTLPELFGVQLNRERTRQPGWLAIVATDDGPGLSGMTARFVSRSALSAPRGDGGSDALRLGSRG